MLDANALALIQRDAVAAACDTSADIYPKVTTKDAYATGVDTWPTRSATVPAGLRQPSATELQNFDFLIGSKVAWTVLMPVGTVVHPQDHLVIEGQTLEVHVPLTPTSYPALLAIICAEIK